MWLFRNIVRIANAVQYHNVRSLVDIFHVPIFLMPGLMENLWVGKGLRGSWGVMVTMVVIICSSQLSDMSILQLQPLYVNNFHLLLVASIKEAKQNVDRNCLDKIRKYIGYACLCEI